MKRAKRIIVGYWLLTLSVLLVCLPAWAGEVDAFTLERAIASRRTRVAEFEVIRKAADRLGLRVYLFGGTAAGFAHYVKRDLLNGGIDQRGKPFDYDLLSIYRSTQDADLVVDGTPEQAAQLEELIKREFSHLQGAKDDWEVRLLRHDRGDKKALLENRDFSDQHSDSHSTGLIELTGSGAAGDVVRDLRSWNSRETPRFLTDVSEGQLTLYFSDRHYETSLYRQGNNPEIFEVLRYFTKRFQYGLQGRAEDLVRVQNLIESFNPTRDIRTDYAERRLERLGRHLLLHARDIEEAWNTLEAIGLRTKLIALSDPTIEGSMGYWLNREPLRSKEVGKGSGRTLAKLCKQRGIDPDSLVFAHEAKDYLAWESQLKDFEGRPNAYISREAGPHENAAGGDGYYTQIGMLGARDTGFTLRYRADLNAREGHDFVVASNDPNYLVWRNRNTLRIIPESLDITLSEYFDFLAEGKSFPPSERGIVERMKKQLSNRPLSDEENDRILRRIEATITSFLEAPGENAPGEFPLVLREWFTLPLSRRHPALAQPLLVSNQPAVWRKAAVFVVPYLPLNVATDYIEKLIETGDPGTWHQLAQFTFSRPEMGHSASLVAKLIDKGDAKTWTLLARYTFSRPHAVEWATLIEKLIDKGDPDTLYALASLVFSKPHAEGILSHIGKLIERGDDKTRLALATYTFSAPHTAKRLDLIEKLIDHSGEIVWRALAEYTFSQPHTIGMGSLIEKLLDKNDPRTDQTLIHYTFSRPHTASMGHFIERLIDKGNANNWRLLAQVVFSKPHTREMAPLIEKLIDKGEPWTWYALAEKTFSAPHTAGMSALVEKLIETGDVWVWRMLAQFTFNQPHTAGMSDLVETMIDRDDALTIRLLRLFALPKPHTRGLSWRDRVTLRARLKGACGRLLSKLSQEAVRVLAKPYSFTGYPEI